MITCKDIENAANILSPYIFRTPLLESPLLNQTLNGRVLFKAECLQRTGSFKIRGASNKMLSLNKDQLARGVVAYSSGNHAQGVAAAAQSSGASATIVIPQDAPELKIANTKSYGANVVLYDRYTENREQIAKEIAEREGRVIVPPYEDKAIISGQGTVGLEIVEQLAERSIEAQALLCPCGGGGLISGLATIVKSKLPDMAIYAVEPKDFDDTRRSLETGERVSNDPEARSICDAIVTPMPGEITFDINRRLLSGGLVVDDSVVVQAIETAFTYLKVVVEPGAAVGLAAILSGAMPIEGKTVVVVLSGGNIEIGSLLKLLKGKAFGRSG
ncbi:MAG: threonine/serine dehydratase [Gammaproteobacteria bacterium]|nr:threonine/serine dehydratase [Gammaproteobacteria bacterium]